MGQAVVCMRAIGCVKQSSAHVSSCVEHTLCDVYITLHCPKWSSAGLLTGVSGTVLSSSQLCRLVSNQQRSPPSAVACDVCLQQYSVNNGPWECQCVLLEPHDISQASLQCRQGPNAVVVMSLCSKPADTRHVSPVAQSSCHSGIAHRSLHSVGW